MSALRYALGKRWHYNWQNLNPRGSSFWNGRAWLYTARHTFHTEWNFGKRARFCHVQLEVNPHGDRGILLGIALPFLFSLWFGVEGGIGKWWTRESREIGVTFNEDLIFVDLWNTPGSWSHNQPWWWHIVLRPVDWLLGCTVHMSRDISTGPIEIEMPEGIYSGTCRIFESTWKRPRWRATKIVRAAVDLPKGIPFPGKGDNDWDMGEDAMFGATFPCASPEAAAEHIKQDVQKYRRER